MVKWKELHKIGITGSRKFKGLQWVAQYLEEKVIRRYNSTNEIVFITGGALGVDSLVESLCTRQGIKFLCIPAKWLELERAAGPIRNKDIVNLSNEMIAFWDEESPGTKQCIEYAEYVKKPITILTVKSLKTILNVSSAPVIVLPSKASSRTAHAVRDIIKDANLEGLFKLKGKKKRKFKWQSGDKYFK
jgi:hypothetical protein